MMEWDQPSTLALLALLIGIALGTMSGYTLALEHFPFQVDGTFYVNDARTDPIRN